MAPAKVNRRRSSRPRRRARAAYERARWILARADEAEMQVLRDHSGARSLLDQVREELSQLALSPKLRIVAVRRRQGAASRRQTTTQALFTACTEIRRRVKTRYRGPRHAELRRAFGEGMPASSAKPESVLRLAQQILAAAPGREEALREVRVGAPTLRRVTGLVERLRASNTDRVEWRSTEQQLSHTLASAVTRLIGLCDEIESIARELGLDLGRPAPSADAAGADGVDDVEDGEDDGDLSDDDVFDEEADFPSEEDGPNPDQDPDEEGKVDSR